VEAELIVALSDESLDLLKIHSAWYKKLNSTSTSNTHATTGDIERLAGHDSCHTFPLQQTDLS